MSHTLKKCDICTFVSTKTSNHERYASSKTNHYALCRSFEVNFWYLHEQYQLSMTLKVHVIIDHYVWYFKQMNKNFYETNGEYLEAVHYSLDGLEKTRNLKVKRNLGSDEHLKRALKSHIFFNFLRIGSPDREMTIRNISPKSRLV